MAFESNQVFNLANEITSRAYSNAGEVGAQVPQWLSAFDVQKLTAGIQIERGWTIGSATIHEVIAEHGKARKQFKRSKLRWRISGGSKRSSGWIPFKARAVLWKNGQVKFAGHFFKVWDSYGLSGYNSAQVAFPKTVGGAGTSLSAYRSKPLRPSAQLAWVLIRIKGLRHPVTG